MIRKNGEYEPSFDCTIEWLNKWMNVRDQRPNGFDFYWTLPGRKFYEIRSHLVNVRAVIYFGGTLKWTFQFSDRLLINDGLQ